MERKVPGRFSMLSAMLREYPEMARMLTIRVTHFDANPHGAKLLNDIAANGVVERGAQ